MGKRREAIPSRVAFGAIYIKEQEILTDEDTVIYLSENPYAQYIVGLKEFRTEPLFEASMIVHFCKRFGPEAIRKVNQILYERMCPREKDPPEGQDGTPAEDNTSTDQEDDDNKGVMILDATVAPADIHYPTDLNLVNGIAKRRYGLNQIMSYLAVTGLTEAAMQILVMNVAPAALPFVSVFASSSRVDTKRRNPIGSGIISLK